MKSSFLLRALILAISIATFRPLFAPTVLKADVISTAQMQVGIATDGNLYDTGAVVGIKRISDGYDPIRPGVPRESWGISAGSIVGFADPSQFPVFHLSTTSRAFTSSGGQITTFLQYSAANLLQIVQKYSFVPGAGNILKILTTVTNVSAVNQAVVFNRNVDWDIVPNLDINSVIPAYSSPIQASFSGFEAPSPLAAYTHLAPATGGTVTGDFGAGMRIDLGTLLPGQSMTFDVFHGISLVGQTRSSLASQMVTAGANVFVASGDGTDHVNSAAMGFGFEPAVVPLPGSVWMGGVLLGLIGIVRLVRRAPDAD
jgi:hypothetical protein